MRDSHRRGHDRGMNDTQQLPPPAGPDDSFDPQRLRTITDMRRSSDDRIVAGVCAGAARYLNIDPVIVRVVLAVLTVAGFAGIILYAAAWVLLPAEGEDRSLAADWFRLDRNEEQVRVVGLVVALVLAGLAIIGDNSWAWWGGAPWWLLPAGLLYWFFVARPRRRRERRDPQPPPVTTTGPDGARTAVPPPPLPPRPRPRRSPALTLLVVSVTAIALAATRIWSEYHRDVPTTAYLAIALGIVGLGLLVGTVVGNGGPLIGIGALLAIALAIGSVLPSGRIGEQDPTPTSAADVESRYTHGIGLLELDLTQVADPDSLLGRSTEVDSGVGLVRIVVPDGLPVRVDAHVRAGEIDLFGRTADGTDVSLTDSDRTGTTPGTATRAFDIEVDHRVGRIEVISR